jgi:hypothetical protein
LREDVYQGSSLQVSKALKTELGFYPNVTYFRRLGLNFFPLKRAVILKARSLRLKSLH